MNNVEMQSRGRVGRRVPVGFLLAALACLGVGALLLPLRAPAHHVHAAVQAPPASTDQSAEIDRLKQAVNLLERQSAALAVAVSSSKPEAAPRPREDPATPAKVEDTRSPAEIQQDEITALEVRFESEKDGSRDSLFAARTMQAELGAAPLGEARIRDVACSASLCRATLEQDASAKPMDMAALIEKTPTVRRESIFNYEQDGSVNRVTIYAAREGHRLNPSDPDAPPNSP